MDLQELRFIVKTEQLDEAAKKIQALGTAVADLESKQKSASQSGKEDAKALKAKLKLESDLVILKAKLAKAEEDAANKANGTTEANKKQTAESSKLASMLERLNSLYTGMAAGNTRAESSILHLAKTLGASDEQFQQVKKSLEQISSLSKSPFDSSLGSLRSIQGELDTLNDRSRLAAQGIALSTNQLKEYSRLGNEIRGQMQGQNLDPTQGSGLAEFNRRLAESQNKYLAIANSVNTLTSEEKKRNDVLTAQRNIMAELEQKNRSIQDSISRNEGITTRMRGGMSQSAAGTDYDNTRKMSSATTSDQVTRIQQEIDLTNKLLESRRKLNAEEERQAANKAALDAIVAQRKAIDDLNKSIIANVAERTRMDALTKKYADMGVSTVANMHGSSNASQLASLEAKGASQASIDSLKNYLLGVQAVVKAREDQKRVEDEVDRANQKIARDAAAARYSALGNSSSISNTAAGMETRGIPQSVINTYIQEANAKEAAAKATRELAAANKYITETEQKLATAVENANQNLNRQATDELTKYQRALQTVGTSAEETTRKLKVFKEQQAVAVSKEREQQLSHLSRSISTQMGDVGISLASGMNPLTVMLQQGDQIRFALQQAGAEGKELQQAMNGAASQIASSIALTFKAMGGFVAGTVATMGKALASFVVAPITFARDVTRVYAEMASGVSDGSLAMAEAKKRLAEAVVSAGKVVLGFTAILATGLAIGLYKVMKEQEELAKQLALTGGSMGVSMNTAINYAQTMNEVGVSTGRATEVITMMAKEGVFLASEIALVTKAAIDMEHYAGVAVEDTVKQFASLRKDPVKAILELSQATGMIAPEVVRAVIELKEQGRTADAVAIAMKASADVSNQTVSQLKEDFTGFALLMKKVSREVSDAFAGMFKGMWVKTPVNEALRETREGLLKQIENMESNQAGNKSVLDFLGIKTDMSKLDELKGKLSSVNRKLRNEDVKGANAQRDKEDQSASSKIIADAESERFKYAERSVTLTRERAGLLEKIKKSERLNLNRETEIFKNSLTELDKKIKEAKESEAKKDRGPKAKTSSFGGVASSVSLVDNTSNIQREYSSELSKTQKFIKSQRDILKLSFEAGLVSRGEYIAKDVDLITRGQSSELNVIAAYGEKIKSEHDRVSEAIEARRKDALAATKDPESITRINREATDQLTKLNEAQKTFNELQADKKEVISFEADKRYYESLKEQNAAMLESKKHLEDLNKTMQDAAEIRALEAQSQWDTMYIAGDELASYKARNEALKDYVKLQSKLRIDADKSGEVYQQMTSGVGPQSEEVQQRAFQQWMLWQNTKDQVVKAGIDGEEAARKASMDAVNKYYMDKAMEVRDGTAAAITEGIMNGGKAGSDAIKNVLNNVLRDMLNNVFKSMLGSIGNEITKAITSGGQQQQSSGGGFLQSIVGFGLNALAGSFGGGASASGSSTYSLGSGTDMTSGLKFRATGGFVNQGSEYMVGENGPEKFIPKQSGTIVPNHKLAKTSASSDPMKVTIINNTSSPIGKVTERQISPTERALVIEEAVQAVASAMHDPNHKVSKSLGQNYKMQRNR